MRRTRTQIARTEHRRQKTKVRRKNNRISQAERVRTPRTIWEV